MNLRVSGKRLLCGQDCTGPEAEKLRVSGHSHAGGQTGKAGVAALVGLRALIPEGAVVAMQWAQRGSLLEPRCSLGAFLGA